MASTTCSSSVMSHTTVTTTKGAQSKAATGPVPKAAATEMSARPPSSVASGKHGAELNGADVASTISAPVKSAAGTSVSKGVSKASTTTTKLQSQIDRLESELSKEKVARLNAQHELDRTARELEALEKVLMLRK